MEQIVSKAGRDRPAFNVWIVDDDASIRLVLERALRIDGILPRVFEAAESALDALKLGTPDVLLTDICMPGQSGLEMLRRIRVLQPDLPVIVMTAYSDCLNAVSAYADGAFEYLPKPFDIDTMVTLVRRAADARRKNNDPAGLPRSNLLLGRAPAMQQVFRTIGRLSQSTVTVLISGEPGTGKRLVARALHNNSPHAKGAFASVNTAALPADLLEAEIFGRTETGITDEHLLYGGRLAQAAGGTLFLVGIDRLSAQLQARLLRLFVEGEFCRVGSRIPVSSAARVIASADLDLKDRVAEGTFRADLYERLSVVQLELPPLRARAEDIPELLDHYLAVAGRKLGIKPKSLARDVQARLLAHSWPGNVRELVDLCVRVSLRALGTEVCIQDLPASLGIVAADLVDADWTRALTAWADWYSVQARKSLLEEAQPRFERALIHAALRRTRGHRREAAELLGWGRNTLTQKMKQLGIESEQVGSE